MTTNPWPAWLLSSSIEFGLSKAVMQSRSPVTQFVQTVDLLAWRWNATVTVPPRLFRNAGAVEAFFNTLVGGTEAVELHHFVRPKPTGTLRGEPVLAAPVLQFAKAMNIQSMPGMTVKSGDMLGIAGQLFQVRDDAVADGGGVLSVVMVNRSRKAIAGGLAVTWNKPSANFAMSDKSSSFAFVPGRLEACSFEFEEVP